MENKFIPIRMCCVCRQHLPKKDLVRVVKNKNNEIFIDQSFKAQGRGAYVCKSEECLNKLIKTRALNRAFKCEVPIDIYKNIKGEF